MAQDLGQAFNWDDNAQVTDSQFELLPAGDYDYEVTNFKRERFDGSAKMAACPVAVLTLRCTNAQASGTGFCRLFLNSKVVWRITQFFKSCGLLNPNTAEGTSFPMSLFEQVVGCTGKVKVTITKSESNGRTYENNDFQFIVPKGTAPAPATTYAPPQQTQQRSWGGQGF
jgi:hypothetical protein